MMEWDIVMAELERFKSFSDDWDGEGTPAPAPEIVKTAIDVAMELSSRRVRPPDRVHVGVNSTIYFEWHKPNYYQAEVVGANLVEWRSDLPRW